ncbi:Uncharacterised protein [Kluyvera intermedia]|nr:Uncharacterised protein [Kluyvera intermedia]
MQGCPTSFDRMIGRAKTLELAYGCPDTLPAEGGLETDGPSDYYVMGFEPRIIEL